MANYFGRQAAGYANEFKQSLGVLIGIATGLLADRQLVDSEVHFLSEWLESHDEISHSWPGDVVCARIQAILADGTITEPERVHLVDTLRALIGGTLEDLTASTHVTELAFDDVERVVFPGAIFCLTGNFVYAPRDVCTAETEKRGGQVRNSVTKKLQYLIVGGLGSPEWKHGSFGTKIEQAIRYKREGTNVLVVHEDRWASSL